ncbi:MAG: ATP-binding protein, partial [Methanobacteriaceae archaeon]|nr:ATP-binding protein [Methanobacteriaceae archaeon]
RSVCEKMPIMEIRERDINFFCKEIVKRILSGYKQNVNVLITGSLGVGKSSTALRIAIICSELIAEREGGKREDFFDINENMGIMNIEEVIKVYEKMSKTKHSVFIIDDASPIISSRKSFDKNNLAQNDMMITQRPNENIVIYTVPQKFLLDKVPRSLSGYIIYMKKSYFQYGYTSADIRKIDFLPHMKEPIYPFLQNHKGEKIKLHFFKNPEEYYIEIYNERRRIAQDALAAKSIETMLKKPDNEIPKTRKGDLYRQIYEEFKAGKFGEMSLKEVCRLKKIPYQSVLNCVGT